MENRTNPAPWHIEGQAILDANGFVVVSAFNPCDMNTRRLIVHAVNKLAAPERNCDRFDGDKDKLIEACLRERGLLVTEDFSRAFCDWLLDNVTKEGGDGE